MSRTRQAAIGKIPDEPGTIIDSFLRDQEQVVNRGFEKAIPRLIHSYGGKGKKTFKKSLKEGNNPYYNIIEDMGRAIEADTFIDGFAGSGTCAFLAMLTTKEKYTVIEQVKKRGRPRASEERPKPQITKTGTPLFKHFIINERDYAIYCLFKIAQRSENDKEPNVENLKEALSKLKYCEENYLIAEKVIRNFYFAESIKKSGIPSKEEIYYYYQIPESEQAETIRKGESYSDLELAVSTFITHNMSFQGSQKGFDRRGEGAFGKLVVQLDIAHKFLNLELEEFSDVPDYPPRNQYKTPDEYSVEITNQDATEIISTFTMENKEKPRKILFMDPPYPPDVRAEGAKDTYGPYEMGLLDHKVGIFQKLTIKENVGWIMCGKVDAEDGEEISSKVITEKVGHTSYKDLSQPYIKREDLLTVNTPANRDDRDTPKKQVELIWHNP